MNRFKTRQAGIILLALLCAWRFVEAQEAKTNDLDLVEEPAPAPVAKNTSEGLRLNFRDAPMDDVLQYLSKEAGFVIIQEAPLTGTISIVSQQPLDADECVDLLNTLLAEKGFTALRTGRFLKIVDRKSAPKHPLPVYTARQPEEIPQNDEMATMIIPVGFADTAQLLENLQPLMPEDGMMSANESSSAIMITGTQANARRMAEIIKALDTSISALSAIRVFPLEYADAKEVAKVVSELFSTARASSSKSGGDRDRGGGGPGHMMMRFGGSSRGSRGGTSGSAGQVIATPDERTNTLIVGAPEEMMPSIEALIKDIDINIQDVTELRLFPLQFADAIELAEMVEALYEEEDEKSSDSSQSRSGPFPFFRGHGHSSGSNNQPEKGQRTLQQTQVVAIGDPRTNTLLVRAARETMVHIAEMIGRLDASSARTEKVHVYPLNHADAENVSRVLQGMFEGSSTRSQNSQTESRLNERSTRGADINTEDAIRGRGR